MLVRDFLERHQSWIYLIAIVAGFWLGLTRPATAEPLDHLLWPLLGVLLYATFTQVPLTRLSLALRDWRFLGALMIGNFLVIPLALGALVHWLPLEPAILVGVLLVLLVPCTDWFISFTHLGRGDTGRAIAATPILLLAQIMALPACPGRGNSSPGRNICCSSTPPGGGRSPHCSRGSSTVSWPRGSRSGPARAGSVIRGC